MHQLQSLFILCVFLPLFAWSQTSLESSGKKIQGDTSLLTNYIWHGITQTKLNPALQSSLYYNLNQTLRFGIWGSNVNYANASKANSLLKLQGDIFIPLSPNISMGIHYSDNHYFETDDRDGNTLGLDFEAFKFNFLYEQESNWQKLGVKSKYLRIRKVWTVFSNWNWENHIGYTQVDDSAIASYFDVLSGIGTSSGPFSWQVGVTSTSNNSQFAGAAETFIYLLLRISY